MVVKIGGVRTWAVVTQVTFWFTCTADSLIFTGSFGIILFKNGAKCL